LNSSIFVNSSILSPDLSVRLENLIQFPNETKFTLIYQASKDGFGLKDFHSKCDNISNTLMIIETTDSFILGGFTTVSWSLRNTTTEDTYHYDSNAFIFSLTNTLNQSFKMNVNKPDSAIYTGTDHVENILYLSYDLPNLNEDNSSIFIGGDSFYASQIEVFVVDGKLLTK